MKLGTVLLLTFLGVSLSSVVVKAQTVAGCSAGSFVDGSANNQIGTSGVNYTPKCLRVKAGASVTISASSHHPLSAMPNIDQVANPFADIASATVPQTRLMQTPGVFGYYCEAHGDAEGDGMAGVIWVIP